MNRPRVLFRVDADAKIGAGHLMRCLALAAALRDKGAEATFLSNVGSAALCETLLSGGHLLETCEFQHPDPRDLACLEEMTKARPKFDWLVLDGYAFDPEYQAAARRMVGKLLVIDDMCQWPRYEGDAILNQNAGAERISYPAPTTTRRLLGREYALLRVEFLRAPRMTRPKRGSNKDAMRVLVTLGGAVPVNAAAVILDGLRRVRERKFEVRALTGSIGPDDGAWQELLRSCVSSGNLSLSLDPYVANMSEPMAWADFAVSAGGSTCWELAHMGVPAFIVVLSADQEAVATAMQAAGCGLTLGRYTGLKADDVAATISRTLNQSATLDEMRVAGMRFIDGLGAARAAAMML